METSTGLRQSASIGKLTEALALAAGEFSPILKETENPFFESQYADLATLIAATRPALSKHGLAIVQSPNLAGQNVRITTIIAHSSGEWLADDLELPAGTEKRFDAQTVGSAITYARRYAYQSILNVAGEEDDDGNAASSDAADSAPRRPAASAEPDFGPLNDEDAQFLRDWDDCIARRWAGVKPADAHRAGRKLLRAGLNKRNIAGLADLNEEGRLEIIAKTANGEFDRLAPKTEAAKAA